MSQRGFCFSAIPLLYVLIAEDHRRDRVRLGRAGAGSEPPR